MAKAKNLDLDNPAPIMDEEDEETLAAIDEGIRDAEAGGIAPAETARELLPRDQGGRPHCRYPSHLTPHPRMA